LRYCDLKGVGNKVLGRTRSIGRGHCLHSCWTGGSEHVGRRALNDLGCQRPPWPEAECDRAAGIVRLEVLADLVERLGEGGSRKDGDRSAGCGTLRTSGWSRRLWLCTAAGGEPQA